MIVGFAPNGGKRSSLTRLYQLEVYGRNSVSIESLACYLRRLANAHCMSIHRISDLLSLHLGSIRNFDFTVEGHFLNAGSGISHRVCSAIEQFTCQNEMLNCTFDFLCRHVGSTTKGLAARTRRWCNECYRCDIDSNSEVYDRLLWAFSCCSHCIEHGLELRNCCGMCGALQPLLLSHVALDRCHACGAELWNGNGRQKSNDDHTKLAVSIEYAKLVESRAAIAGSSYEQAFAAFLRSVVDSRQIYAVELSRKVGLPDGTIPQWLRARNRPHLDYFVDTCINLSVSPVLVLTEPFVAAQVALIPERPIVRSRHIVKRGYSRRDKDKIKRVVGKIMRHKDRTCLKTAVQIAEKLAVPVGTLYHHCGSELHALAEYQKERRAITTRRDIRRVERLVRLEIRKRAKRGDPTSQRRVVAYLHRRTRISYPRLRAAYNAIMVT